MSPSKSTISASHWLKLSLEICEEQANQIADLLSTTGAISVSLQDSADEAIFEAVRGTTELWPNTQISALYPPATNVRGILHQIHETLGLKAPPPYTLEHLQDQQWERVWLDRFKPMQFGERLWVCPSGQAAPDPDAINLILDPGLAFGTGTHATTALCLEWLAQTDIENRTVIDYGCGSGILSIAAAKLGARHVWAVDVDMQALESTTKNASQNGVDDRITPCLPIDLPVVNSDCVIANILATPLIELAPEFTALLSRNGQLILSGVLADEQMNAVSAAYKQWFDFVNITKREEWVRLDAIKIN